LIQQASPLLIEKKKTAKKPIGHTLDGLTYDDISHIRGLYD